MRVVEFFPETFTEDDWESYFQYRELILKEQNPDDPLPSMEPHRKYMLNPEPNLDISWWLALEENSDRVVGRGAVWWDNENSGNYEERKYDARTDFILLPEYRNDLNHAKFFLEVARVASAHEK